MRPGERCASWRGWWTRSRCCSSGATLLGSTTAANGQSRYAATDLARPDRRARALSLVVWATTAGAVVGPNLNGFAGRVAVDLGLPRLTGPFLFGTVGILAAGLVVGVFLRPDPLLVAREAAMARGAGTTRHATPWRRVWDVVRSRPPVAAGIALAGAGARRDGGDHGDDPAAHALRRRDPRRDRVRHQRDVLGMFFLAPVVGLGGRPLRARRRDGARARWCCWSPCCCPAPRTEGASFRIGMGLFLLGLGWSFCTVAASALLSESAPLDARTDVQGAADLVMGLVAAAAGAVAGW